MGLYDMDSKFVFPTCAHMQMCRVYTPSINPLLSFHGSCGPDAPKTYAE